MCEYIYIYNDQYHCNYHYHAVIIIAININIITNIIIAINIIIITVIVIFITAVKSMDGERLEESLKEAAELGLDINTSIKRKVSERASE